MEAVMTSLARVHGAQATMKAVERSSGSGFATDDAQGARQRLISAAQFGKLRLDPAAYESGRMGQSYIMSPPFLQDQFLRSGLDASSMNDGMRSAMRS